MSIHMSMYMPIHMSTHLSTHMLKEVWGCIAAICGFFCIARMREGTQNLLKTHTPQLTPATPQPHTHTHPPEGRNDGRQ